MKIFVKLFFVLFVNFNAVLAKNYNFTNKINKLYFNETRNFNEFFKLTQNLIIDLDNEKVSLKCKESYKLFQKSLQNFEYWALNSKFSLVH